MKKVSNKKNLALLSALALTGSILASCGGGEGTSSSSGNVSLFVTDDISTFKEVKAKVNKIQLVHTGTGASCDVLTEPAAFDITNLAGVMQLLNNATCPAENFNRIRIEFDKTVTITDAGNTTNTCSFSSYKDDHNKPNVLQCSGDTCSMDINGAINVLANKNNKLALDFNLKEFEVEDFGANCSVTLKVSPLNASEMEDKKGHDGSKEAATGLISNLDSSSDTFTLTKGRHNFTVNYSGISQSHIDDLLKFADDNDLKVRAFCSNSISDTSSCSATSIFVKVEGTVSSHDGTNHTFTLTSKGGKEIKVDYTNAFNNNEIEGNIMDGKMVEVKLTGIDDSGNFLATEVEHTDGEDENENENERKKHEDED